MNMFGSYRRLRDNAVAAMVGAIEIYNKPRFAYRDECAVILLVNAWELLFKATLSKHRKSIYYPKVRGDEYRTLNWTHAARKVATEGLWPTSVAQHALVLNIEHLAQFRDNAVHFYNADDFGLLVHSLAQQSIMNFRDYLRATFGRDLADEISWSLMPLGLTPPGDPVTYLRAKGGRPPTAAVREFLDSLEGSVSFLRAAGEESGRLMTQLPVHLVSVKKASGASTVIGVDPAANAKAIVKRVDPNISHPLTTAQVLAKVGAAVAGRPFTTNTFYAIADQRRLRSNDNLHYRPRAGSPQWSEDVVVLLKSMSTAEIDAALEARRKDLAAKRLTRAKT